MKVIKIFVLLLGSFFMCAAQATEQKMPANATFEAGFSPNGQSLNLILKAIGQAKTSLHVAAYLLTSKPVATALVDAHKRGVEVRVVADKKENTRGYSGLTYLVGEGVPVRLNDQYAIHHHKFMVIDGEHVQLGSFNYTVAAAKKNAENVLLLQHVKPLADQYEAEWKRLWSESEPMKKAY